MPITGVVQFFNVQRGFGFVRPDNGDRDVFLHITAVRAADLAAPPSEGDRLSFDAIPGRGGKLQAINIALVS